MPLIEYKDIHLNYDNKTVFTGFSLTVRVIE